MDECELITLVTAIACALSKTCSNDDITLLAAVFSQLGDTLNTVLAKREINEDRITSGSDNIDSNITETTSDL